MRDPVNAPPLRIWPDRDTVQSWRWLEAETPVDFTQEADGTGYEADIMLLRCGSVIWQGPLDLDADGYLTVTIPASIGQTLRSRHRIDATYQINITAPIREQSAVWIGAVSVHEVHA